MVALAGLTVALNGLTTSAGSLSGLLSSIGGAVASAGAAIMGAIGPAIDFVKEKFQGVKDFWNENIAPVFDQLLAFAQPALEAIGAIFSATFGTAFDVLKAAWEVLMAALQVAWNTIVDPLISVFTGLFTAGMALVQGDWDGVMEGLKGVWDSVLMPIIQPFVDLFNAGMALAKGNWDSVMESLKAAWDNSLGKILQPFIDPLLAAFGSIQERWSAVSTALSEAWDAYVKTPIMAVFGPLFESIGAIRENWDVIMVAMKAAFDRFTAPITAVLGVILSPFKLAWDGIIAGIDLAKSGFDNFATGLQSAYDNYIGPALDSIWSVLEPIVDGMAAVAGSVGGFIGDTVSAGADLLGFSEGGVASGPAGGYPVMLHGTEAVVPLSGGRSIPVEMKGGGGGGGNTFNISINPSGITDRTDKREMARQMGNMIQQEVARALGGTTMRGRF